MRFTLKLVLKFFPFFCVVSFAQPFDRAMVFSGGSHQTASFLGMVEYSIENGWKPDVIISTCGSSIANQIFNLSDDPAVWRKIIESREFYELLKRERINPNLAQGTAALSLIARNAVNTLKREALDRPQVEFLPDIFSPGLLYIPTDGFTPTFNVPFSSSRGIRSVIVAARVNYSPDEVGQRRRNRKTLTETYFTDPDTAKFLSDFKTPMAVQFPNSVVSPDTLTVSDRTLAEAARASISEPILMNIASFNERGKKVYYLAGSVDSYPIEVGQHLAKEVIASRVGYISDLETMVGENVHGFNMNERRRLSHQLTVDHWIDRTGFYDIDDLEPKKKFTLSGGKLLYLVTGIPDSYEEYVKVTRKHWKHGREEMARTFKSPKNSIDHIQRESTDGHREGFFNKAGNTLKLLAAPASTAWALEEELEEHDGDLESGFNTTLGTHGPSLGLYAGATALFELIRYGFLETSPNRLSPPQSEKPRLVIDLRKKGSVPKAQPHVVVVRASNAQELQSKLDKLGQGPFGHIDILADTVKGRPVFSDKALLSEAKLPRLGSPKAKVRFLISKLGRSQKGVDDANQVAAQLSEEGEAVVTRKNVINPAHRLWHYFKITTAHAAGLRNLNTIIEAASGVKSAQSAVRSKSNCLIGYGKLSR